MSIVYFSLLPGEGRVLFSSEYNKFLFFPLSVSSFGPHVSKSVRARMNARMNTYRFAVLLYQQIESNLTAFVHIQATFLNLNLS